MKSPFLTPSGFVLSKFHGLAIVLEKVMDREIFFHVAKFLKFFKNVKKCKENAAFLNLKMDMRRADRNEFSWRCLFSQRSSPIHSVRFPGWRFTARSVLLRIVQNSEKICSFRMRYLACPGKFCGKSSDGVIGWWNDQILSFFWKSDQIRRVSQNFAAPPGA